jgi:multidrug efflux system membrane fusion protein
VIRLPGVVRARERAELAFLHSGHLAERRVERGQRVQAGEVLAVLHNPALMPGADAAAARAREAQLNLEQLDREVERLQDLASRDLVPTEELERIVARRDAAVQASNQAEAALGEAREQLDEAMLRAPFGGAIGALLVEPGQFVAAGQPVLRLIGSSGLETSLHLPTSQAARLTLGGEVTVKSCEAPMMHGGTIREISTAAPGEVAEIIIDLTTASDPADPTASTLRSGQSVEVTLPLAAPERLSVPMAALTQSSSGLARIFRIEENQAIAVDVRPGQLRGGWLDIDGALAEGDLVVVAGHGRLLDGDRVRLLQ